MDASMNVFGEPDQESEEVDISTDIPLFRACPVESSVHFHFGKSFTQKSPFQNYEQVATKLLEDKCYDPLLTTILKCYDESNTFIVLDCASGFGKSQAGIALSLLETRKLVLVDKSSVRHPFKFAHCVWNEAVKSQAIYKDIVAKQHEKNRNVSVFFQECKILESLKDRENELNFKKDVWSSFLSQIFRGEDDSDAFFGNGIFVIMIDEVPVDAKDLALIGNIRDVLKLIDNIVLILSGTNSKAANMIGLTRGDASSSDKFPEQSKWSFLMTRLPKFKLVGSSLGKKYQDLKASCVPYDSKDLNSAIDCIDLSIQRNGNPRLINLAIAALLDTLAQGRPFEFTIWQENLAIYNISSKFTVSKWGNGFEILTGQSNLLLGASAHYALADAMIHRHYAQRAFPDQGKTSVCQEGSKCSECGGWLCIAPSDWRCLGRILYTDSMIDQDFSASDWQCTMFQTVQNDILLYLACCWKSGYLSMHKRLGGTACSHLQFRAFDFMRAAWQPNVSGGLNFQNTQAVINTGAFLEVLVALAVMNAAALSPGITCTFVEFFSSFLKEMGIKEADGEMSEIAEDLAFKSICIPRYVFPGTEADLSQVLGSIGIYERSPNMKEKDSVLYNVKGKNGFGKVVNTIQFEAKDRKKSESCEKIAAVAKKLVARDGNLGIMCVKASLHFEPKADGTDTKVLTRLLSLLQDSQVEKMYFVEPDGSIHSSAVKSGVHGRFIIVQIPKH